MLGLAPPVFPGFDEPSFVEGLAFAVAVGKPRFLEMLCLDEVRPIDSLSDGFRTPKAPLLGLTELASMMGSIASADYNFKPDF